MDHEHGIRGGEGVLPEHYNATQNQSSTQLVRQLLRVIVAPDNMKTIPVEKTAAPA